MDPALLGLPHRDPFLFIDEVFDFSPGSSIRGRKTFAATEAFFTGHFPGDPIVPGVILTEALAQLSGILAARDRPGAAFLLSAVRLMKFLHPVRPEEPIELTATFRGELGALLSFSVRAEALGLTVAEGEILLNRRS